jgi:hypothetical protein
MSTSVTPRSWTSVARAEPTEPHTNQIGRYPMHFHHLMGPMAAAADRASAYVRRQRDRRRIDVA